MEHRWHTFKKKSEIKLEQKCALIYYCKRLGQEVPCHILCKNPSTSSFIFHQPERYTCLQSHTCMFSVVYSIVFAKFVFSCFLFALIVSDLFFSLHWFLSSCLVHVVCPLPGLCLFFDHVLWMRLWICLSILIQPSLASNLNPLLSPLLLLEQSDGTTGLLLGSINWLKLFLPFWISLISFPRLSSQKH